MRLLPALALLLVFASPAAAAPRWLDAGPPFGLVPALPADASAAMAPDGTVVVARFAPDGALEVRERPPGGPYGATIDLPRVSVAPPANSHLRVLTGADGSAALVFDVGNERYAAVRAPGGRWTDPAEAAPAGGAAALGPDGRLWLVSRATDRDDTLAVYRFVPGGRPVVIPLLDDGARQTAPAITVPAADRAHVTFLERASTPGADGTPCVLRSKVREADVSPDGLAGPVWLVERAQGEGRIAENTCSVETGEVLAVPVLLATDDGGADTITSTRLSFTAAAISSFARHRPRGGEWPPVITPAESVSRAGVTEQLLGGPGAPLAVVRSGVERAIATRGADGAWTPQPLVGDEGARTFDAARTGTGAAVFAWTEREGDVHLIGRVLGADGTLHDPVPLAPATFDDTLLSVGADADGNAVALVAAQTPPPADGFVLGTYGYDGAGPRVTSLSLPGHAVAGVFDLFSATGLDVWSGPAQDATWVFGDGAVEDGITRPHAYATGGRKTVEVRLRDSVGNETSATAPLDVADAPPPAGPVAVPAPPTTPARDLRAPRLTHVVVTPRRPHSARPGLLRLTTDEAGEARVELAKQARGVRRGKRCVATTRARGRACTRTIAHRVVETPIAAGDQRISLPRLSAGTWRLRVVVTDAAGNPSRARTLTVRVA